MPLKLSLKPGEKFVINGAVVANGDKRTTLVVQNQAAILREKEILQVEEVTTPTRRIYFPIMMMYLDAENHESYYDEFALRMTEFMQVVANPEVLATCVMISKEVMRGEYYRALIHAKKLFAYEDERLSYVPQGLPTNTEETRQPTGH
ncbi:MAG TPA: flagellar biosynthesis repressor FlbT [Alphaproteobacteria bacterium]|nr:flagellar biosynthesis repressor FlbT [Alphaproteobacteria bacterium]